MATHGSAKTPKRLEHRVQADDLVDVRETRGKGPGALNLRILTTRMDGCTLGHDFSLLWFNNARIQGTAQIAAKISFKTPC